MKLANHILQISTGFASPSLVARISDHAFGGTDQQTFLPEMIEDDSFARRKAFQAFMIAVPPDFLVYELINTERSRFIRDIQ